MSTDKESPEAQKASELKVENADESEKKEQQIEEDQATPASTKGDVDSAVAAGAVDSLSLWEKEGLPPLVEVLCLACPERRASFILAPSWGKVSMLDSCFETRGRLALSSASCRAVAQHRCLNGSFSDAAVVVFTLGLASREWA